MHQQQRELAWVPWDWWGIFQHFQFCFTFLLIIEYCSCFLSICNVPVSLCFWTALSNPHVAPMLQPDACWKFSCAFPKRLRCFFLFAFSQLSYVFSLTPFKNLPSKQSSVQHSNNLWAVILGAAMETEELLEKSFLATQAPHLQPGAHHLKLLS